MIVQLPRVRLSYDRSRRFDLRPLDPMRSLKAKVSVVIGATVSVAVLLTWLGLQLGVGPRWTLPGAILGSLIIAQLLARGMTYQLREMTAAAQQMARGNYDTRVTVTSQDEVAQLAEAFNLMATDLATTDEQRRELVANVSHELRTPIAALQAELENLVDGVTEPDPATLQTALNQTEKLSELVRQLLDLSRLEAGAVSLNVQPVHMRSFIVDSVERAKMVAERVERHVSWEIEVEPDDLTIQADPSRLGQVVTNLLDNASRHSPEGGVVRTAVRVATPSKGRQEVILTVHDHGPGIAKEERDRVFERFHRGTHTGSVPIVRDKPDLTSSSSPGGGGTGLGLAIARWAVELHGGRISIAESDVGCLMRVCLPYAPYAPVTQSRILH